MRAKPTGISNSFSSCEKLLSPANSDGNQYSAFSQEMQGFARLSERIFGKTYIIDEKKINEKYAGGKSFGAGQLHQPFILLMRRSVTIRMSSVVPIVTRRYDRRSGVLKWRTRMPSSRRSC